MTLCLFLWFLQLTSRRAWGGTGAGALFLCIIVVSTWPPSKGLRPLGMGPPICPHPGMGAWGGWLVLIISFGNLPARSCLVFWPAQAPYLERS